MVKTGYNIVLLTVDALRYDKCGFNGYQRNVTPRIDDLLQDGVIFDNIMSTGPCTPPAFCSMFTGTYPFDKGGYSPLPLGKISIAQVLEKHGYFTAGFHSNPLISHFFNYHRGFKKYYDSMSSDEGTNPVFKKILGFFEKDGQKSNVMFNQLQNLPIPKVLQTNIKNLFYRLFLGRQVKYYDPANSITKRVIRWLKHAVFHEKDGKRKQVTKGQGRGLHRRKVKTPIFLWVHYMDTHDPFMPQDYNHLEQVNARISKREFEHNKKYPEYTDILKEHDKKQRLIDFYDAEIPSVDENISTIVTLFKKHGEYDKTIFILTSDHGEEFNEHGDYGHRAHLYDELPHVPFAIFGGPIEREEIPGLNPGTRVPGLSSLIQLPPTILELAGLENDPAFDSESLLKNIGNGNPGLDHVMACTFHKGIVTRFNQASDRTIKKMVSVRTNEFKYIYDQETESKELYNLKTDEMEQQDISEKHPRKSNEFHELCEYYINCKGAALGKSSDEHFNTLEKRKISNIAGKLKMKL
ncbi:sulfatase-like hydrolase/transferase [Candidatus Bathyarchaeota archaeon]|nr:sulfatase-like hydrolase/transferase [Candidatus Bathyarchaeota archaeon]